jgi:hypothetical protein
MGQRSSIHGAGSVKTSASTDNIEQQVVAFGEARLEAVVQHVSRSHQGRSELNPPLAGGI